MVSTWSLGCMSRRKTKRDWATAHLCREWRWWIKAAYLFRVSWLSERTVRNGAGASSVLEVYLGVPGRNGGEGDEVRVGTRIGETSRRLTSSRQIGETRRGAVGQVDGSWVVWRLAYNEGETRRSRRGESNRCMGSWRFAEDGFKSMSITQIGTDGRIRTGHAWRGGACNDTVALLAQVPTRGQPSSRQSLAPAVCPR
jgi:hypothetical protein